MGVLIKEKRSNYKKERVIELESWEYYENLFINKKDDGIIYKDINSSYIGNILPKRDFNIKDLKYDDNKLTCTIILWNKDEVKVESELLK